MFRPRVIPVLLLQGTALVKTVRFREPRYIGDPINAIKIFNDLGADELVLLDILATRERRSIAVDLVRTVGSEATMPIAVGGGVRSLAHIRDLLAAGVEKVVIGSQATENPDFVRQASTQFGASTIVVCIDVKKRSFMGPRVCSAGGTAPTWDDPVDFAKSMEDLGAGELIVQSIDRDGTLEGYDVDLLRRVSESVSIPVIALGGAATTRDFHRAYADGHASAVAAGTMFVTHGRHRGVLINYPTRAELPF